MDDLSNKIPLNMSLTMIKHGLLNLSSLCFHREAYKQLRSSSWGLLLIKIPEDLSDMGLILHDRNGMIWSIYSSKTHLGWTK